MDLSILALYNMRGNWEESEPLALAPESSHHLGSNLIGFQKDQQQSPSSPDKPSSLDMVSSTPTTTTTKQQQQQQQEAAAYPLTTPAWANLAVKDEPLDEKNNDSGISPGHYNSDTPSPNSDRSINMVGVNGLSPTSASSASPEPRHPLVANDMSYDYSRHHMHHNGGSSVGIPSPEDMSRDASMSPPSQMQHHDSNDSNNNEGQNVPGESIEHPIVNSQGKVKTFRCKQCPFVAVTKRDFWTHTSSHIKPEKLLTCPKCPFVTEYKHHLEYHLRNHFGSKPYKCDKCSYSCVNKSMLNSHLKSHSNVYQFRCADCSYATKYCHSLKLHLRKYQHKPAMVLNADGTPNPLPIIDVYGTKRGPKTKPKKDTAAQNEQSQTQPKQPQQQQLPAKQQSPPPSLMNGAGLLTPTSLPMPATMTPQFQFNAMNGINAFNGFNGTNTLPVTAASMPFLAGFPYNQIFSGFPLGNPFAAAAVAANNLAAANNAANNEEQQQQLEPTNYTQQAMMNGGGILMAKREASPIDYSEHSSSPSPDLEHDDAPVDLTEGKSAPLDLSKPETPKQAPRVHASTNRRKGRAVKLDRRLMEKDSDEEMPEEEKVEPPPAQTNVYMQLKHLRNDMQHMYKYICRLEENLCTRQ